jgi:hypothetical protein
MRSRLVRLGTVAISLLALIGTTTPPAEATTVLEAVFVGSITLLTPIGYPCIGGGTIGVTTLDTSLCPPPVGMTVTLDTHLPLTTILPGGITVTTPQPQLKITHLNNVATIVGFGASPCIVVEVNNPVTKPGPTPGTNKPLTHLNLGCSVLLTTGSLPNTLSGDCWMNSGQVAQLFNDGLGNIYMIDMQFLAVLGYFIVSGHSVKLTGGQRGLLVGIMELLPPQPPPIGDGSSCFTKTARAFTVIGTLALVSV